MKLFTRRFVKDIIYIGLFALSFYILTHNPYVYPKAPDVNGFWSIQLMQKPIVLGIAGHNYLVLKDTRGTIMGELHGLATDSRTGDWKFIGRDPSDQLKVWEFNDPLLYRTHTKTPGIMLYKGDKITVTSYWSKARTCKEEINAKDYLYPPYGVKIEGDTENSNSVAYTLTRCMGLETENLGLITPGWGKDLLQNR